MDEVFLGLQRRLEFRNLLCYLHLVLLHNLLHEVFHLPVLLFHLPVHALYLLVQGFYLALPFLQVLFNVPYVLLGGRELLPDHRGFHELELVGEFLVFESGIPVVPQLVYYLLLLLQYDFRFPDLLLNLLELLQRLVSLLIILPYPGDLIYYLPPLNRVHLYHLGDVPLPYYVVPAWVQSCLHEYVKNLLACRYPPVQLVGGNPRLVQPPAHGDLPLIER